MLIGESVAGIAEQIAPRDPAQGMTFNDARALVNHLLQNDPRAVDLLAGLLARGLSGEAAYLDLARRRVKAISANHISFQTRRAIIKADADLKRAGVTSKGDRTKELAQQFAPISARTIREITPKQARGRPKKTGAPA